MRKNRFIVLLVLGLLVCLTITACSEKTTDPNTSGSVVPGEKNEDPKADTPDIIVTFDSVTDIIEFVSAANSQETQFSEYAEKHDISKNVTYNAAKNFATDCGSTKILCNKSDVVCDSFSGTYYSERDELSLIYKVDDITYRFIYTFGSNTPYEYDGSPVLQGVKVGPFELDLYQGDGRLVGFVIDGDTTIRIIVKAEQISDINFEAFTTTNSLSKFQTE